MAKIHGCLAAFRSWKSGFSNDTQIIAYRLVELGARLGTIRADLMRDRSSTSCILFQPRNHESNACMPKARETCTECSVRRQKCDKGDPCGRCVKRGKADYCTRDWSKHRGAVRSARSKLASRESIDVPSTISGSSQSPSDAVSVLRNVNRQEREVEVSTLDFMTWKPAERTFEAHNEFEGQLVPQSSDHIEQLSGLHSSISILQMLLPNVGLMWKLINFHEKRLLWYHGCYHGPTFNEQVQERIDHQSACEEDTLHIKPHDLQWIALLFSVLAGSLTSANEQLLTEWGFSRSESLQLCTQWYNAATTSLKLGNYMSDHNILGAQAIATLTMCAHTLGFSSDLHVHLGAALRIAQSLNIHRIKSDDPIITEHSSDIDRQAVLKKEISRRLWSQLCIQDWFSIPLAEAHSIHRGHFTTRKPMDRDHITMVPLEDSTPTYVSYGNYLYEIAALIAEMHAKSVGMNTDYTRYQLVLEYDNRMRQLATSGRPHYFDVTVPINECWPWFIPWARRSLTICFAHKIMMIHRAFLKRSFTNPAFSLTRRTCIAAAKTILNEAKSGRAQDEPIIWIDNAFCIAAAITLALDLRYRKLSEPEHTTHRSMVEECIEMLKRQANSTLAIRGVRLLRILLEKSMSTTRYITSRATEETSDLEEVQINNFTAVHMLNAIHGADERHTKHNGSRMAELSKQATAVPTESDADDSLWYNDDLFTELFPPQAGFSNAYLFEELLDLNLER